MRRNRPAWFIVCLMIIAPTASSAAGDDWHWKYLGPWPDRDFLTVGAGGGRVIALHSEGSVVSDDGVVWRTGESWEWSSAFGLLWANGEFLSLGYQLRASRDGLHWNLRGKEGGTTSGAWNGQRYVLLNSWGWVSISTDGRHWRRIDLPPSDHPKSIVWGAGRFVACGYRGVYVSEDGESWSHVDDHMRYQDIVWTGSQFVAITSTHAMLSDDGLTWIRGGELEPCSICEYSDRGQYLATDGARLVAARMGKIETSVDGWAWEVVHSGDGRIEDVTWTGERWIAVGSEGLMLVSSDGQSWAEVGFSLMTSPINDIAWNGSTYLAVGGINDLGGDYSTQQIWRSEDLENWELVWEADGWQRGGPLKSVVWDGERWLVLACRNRSWVMSSGDGRAWTTVLEDDPQFRCDPRHGYGVAGLGTAVFGGIANGAGFLVHTEGAGWNAVSLDNEPYGSVHRAVWTGSRFVAVLDSGRIAASDDGMNWDVVAQIGGNHSWSRLAYNGTDFLVVGYRGLAALSVDNGLTWLEYTTGFDASPSSLVWAGDRWIASGSDVSIQSFDGMTWTQTSDSAQQNMPTTMVWDGERVVGIGPVTAVWSGAAGPRDLGGHHVVVPVAARNYGVGGIPWRSDVFVASMSASRTELWMGLAGDDLSLWRHTWLPPRGQLASTDTVGWWLDRPGETAPLVIRSNRPVAVSSRTYTEGPAGTYGQGVIPRPPQAMIEGTDPAILVGLREDEHYRTNLGISNLGDEPLDLVVTLTRGDGTHLGELPMTVPGRSVGQVNAVLAKVTGWPVADAWAEVVAGDPDATYFAYASVVDNLSGDGVTIMPGVNSETTVVIPAVASTPGIAGTYWRSDLVIANPGDVPAECRVEVVATGDSKICVESLVFEIAPQQSLHLEDVLATVFDADGIAALKVITTTGKVVASSRTFTESGLGSFGQAVPAFPDTAALGPDETGWLPGLRESQDYRSNLGLVNYGDETVEVAVQLVSDDGWQADEEIFEVPAATLVQLNRVLAPVSSEMRSSAYAVVRNLDPAGSIFVWASIVDNSSGDPVFVPAQTFR